MLEGIGPATLRKMAATIDFESPGRDNLAHRFPAIAILRDGQAWARALEDAHKQEDEAQRQHVRILSPLDPAYPRLLAATKDAPFLLYVRGQLAPDPAKSIAVIGTRTPTADGKAFAQRISRYLVEQGCSIVSGLALGCDAIAHQAALDGHGHTVAVLAHGLHTVTPKANRRLADAILDRGGAWVCAHAFGVEPRAGFLVKRDRIQAGLAQGVVMVQSSHQGGSLHAARAALDHGRWLAVPDASGQDRRNREATIQANLTLADGSVQERTALLQCPPGALERVVILRSDDYARLPTINNLPDVALPPAQVKLL